MGMPLAADTEVMEMCYMWRCPGCGVLVCLPASALAPDDTQSEKRLDQLAQASCGCWASALPARGMGRLLKAIVNVDRESCRSAWVIFAPRF
jgi:hypothetical protein